MRPLKTRIAPALLLLGSVVSLLALDGERASPAPSPLHASSAIGAISATGWHGALDGTSAHLFTRQPDERTVSPLTPLGLSATGAGGPAMTGRGVPLANGEGPNCPSGESAAT